MLFIPAIAVTVTLWDLMADSKWWREFWTKEWAKPLAAIIALGIVGGLIGWKS
jgi:hypothetical protein